MGSGRKLVLGFLGGRTRNGAIAIEPLDQVAVAAPL
ncbi:hypothetical protein SPAN111604_04600 [Sphingomonas antarctica]